VLRLPQPQFRVVPILRTDNWGDLAVSHIRDALDGLLRKKKEKKKVNPHAPVTVVVGKHPPAWVSIWGLFICVPLAEECWSTVPVDDIPGD
jgi:hypothetical protein